MSSFDRLLEQPEAKRLLGAALAEDAPPHALLFHGPGGVGKRTAAMLFAGELLEAPERVARLGHPDLYVLEPVGDQIRIDEIRALRRDLHLRPYEAERRVYVVLDADTMNDEAADALLKDLEEPPAYAVVVLVAESLAAIPATIRSRCQLVPFRRLSEKAVREVVAREAPGLADERAVAVARLSGGRLDRARRLLDEDAAARRDAVLEAARSVYAEEFDPVAAARSVLAGVQACGAAAKAAAEQAVEQRDLPKREAETYVRRAQRGAEKEELLGALDELAAWYRDLVAVAAGAERTAVHVDRIETLRAEASRERMLGAEHAAGLVRETWHSLSALNLNAQLALEALFVQLRRELAPTGAAL